MNCLLNNSSSYQAFSALTLSAIRSTMNSGSTYEEKPHTCISQIQEEYPAVFTQIQPFFELTEPEISLESAIFLESPNFNFVYIFLGAGAGISGSISPVSAFRLYQNHHV